MDSESSEAAATEGGAPSWPAQIRQELDEFAHGAAGGFLFGVPLLYTMELWFTGMRLSTWHALGLVAIVVALSFVFVATIGFREAEPPGWRDVATETIDAVGISVVVTIVTLWALGRIGPDVPLDATVGRIAIEMLPVSLGVAISNHLLPRQEDRTGEQEDRANGREPGQSATLRDLVASGGGALLLSLNIAPTDEVAILAAELSEPRLVVLLFFSLAISYMIVFEAGFRNQDARHVSEGPLQRPLTETIVAYLIGLAVCCGALYLVGALPPEATLGTVLSMTVVLGFPGALGAAAGRLAV